MHTRQGFYVVQWDPMWVIVSIHSELYSQSIIFGIFSQVSITNKFFVAFNLKTRSVVSFPRPGTGLCDTPMRLWTLPMCPKRRNVIEDWISSKSELRKAVKWLSEWGRCLIGPDRAVRVEIWSGPIWLSGWTGLAVSDRIWVVNSWSGERPQTRSSTRGWPGRSRAALRGRDTDMQSKLGLLHGYDRPV